MTFKTLSEKNIPLYAVELFNFSQQHLPKRSSNIWELKKIRPILIVDTLFINGQEGTYIFDSDGNHWRFDQPFVNVYENVFTQISFRFQTWSDYLKIAGQNYFKDIPFVFGNQIYCQILNRQRKRCAWININLAQEIYALDKQLLLSFDLPTLNKKISLITPYLTPTMLLEAFQLSELYYQFFNDFSKKMAYSLNQVVSPRSLSCFTGIQLELLAPLPINVQHIKEFHYFLPTYEYLHQIDSSINQKNSTYLARYGFDTKTIQSAMTHYRFHLKKNVRNKSLK